MNVTAIQTTIISGRIAISADGNIDIKERNYISMMHFWENGGGGGGVAMRFVICIRISSALFTQQTHKRDPIVGLLFFFHFCHS